MSIKKIFVIINLGLFSAFIISQVIKNNDKQTLISKKYDFSPSLKRQIASKTNAMMEIQIESINGIPDHDEQDISLKATVTLKRAVDSDLNFKWMLPDDVKVVAGHVEDGWHNIQPGQSVTTEITLTGVSKESPGKPIMLHVNSTNQGFNIGYSGVFAVESEEVALPEEKKDKLEKVSKSKEEIYSERLKGISF